MRNYFSKLGTQVPWRTSQSRGATLALPLRYLSALFLLLTFSIGQSWAEDVTVDLALAKNTNPSPSIGAIIGTNYNKSNFDGTGYKIGSDNNSIGWDISASGKTFTAVTFKGYINTTNTSKNWGFKFSTDGGTTWGSELTQANDGTKSYHDISVTVTIPSGANAIQIIRKAGTSTYVSSITLTLASGGGDPVCPSGLTISSKDSKTAFTEGDAIELTAALSAGNGDISYQWYKGGTAEGNKLTGKTTNKLQIASCTTADEGSYYCVASKTSCSDAVNSSAFSITVEADTKCFNMPAITSKPADLASVVVTGGTLSDVSTAKAVAMNANGLKLDGNSVYLKVTLADASIVEDTKITVAWKGAGSGAGIAVVNGDLAEKVIDETGVEAAGSVTHTFTAAEAANYADEFIIHRNASGTGIYVNAITVEDCGPAVTKHTVTLNYNDGETPAGSLTVVDGNAAVKPADPTRGKYTFLGWFVGDTDNEYEWSTAVTGDLTLKAHWQDPWTLTFNADGGSEVADITVKHNTKAEKPTDPTKDDYDFMGWYYGSPAVAFDWDANVTQDYALVAHWESAVAKYDVEYYDGDTKIGTEPQVWATGHPTAAGIETAKPLYSFVGWYLTSALEGDPVALNTVTPVEGLKLYGKWTKAYATSYDMEAYAVSDGATLETLLSNLDAAGYAYTNVYGIDNGHTHNYIYDGMKYKTNDGDLSFNVNAGKLVIVKTGNLPANALTMYINGVADPTVFVGANEALETHVNNYFYSAAEALYRLDIQASKGTCAIKAVTITDPFTVSFDANGGDDVTSLNGTPSVTLPLPVKGTESFLGWFDGETKVGMNGDKYTPTANITLKAQWEAVSTDARIKALSYTIGGGAPVDIYEADKNTFNISLPYAQAYDAITVAVTPNNDLATIKAGAELTVSSIPGAATFTIVAQSGAEENYTVNFAKGPKDGVCLVWADATGNNAMTVDAEKSLFDATAAASSTKNTSTYGGKTGYKLNSRPANMSVTLSEETFKAGDVVEVFVTSVVDNAGANDKMRVFTENDVTKMLVEGDADMVQGANRLVLPATTTNALYLVRGPQDAAYEMWNPYVAYIAVYRPMNPVLTAITINGETGTINESAKTVAVELQPGYDLADLTINTTIVSNTAEADVVKTVESNSGNWVIGDNTYRLTDKDGDYTEYTVTISEGEVKHTVSFNTHGGSTIDPVQVVDGQQLEAAPADPEKEDYIFQGWAETEDGDIVDVTSFTISADKEFHAVWVSDGAIKLLDGATVNHTNFITGVTADETVEFMGNTVNYAKFSGTVSGVNGVKDLTRVIAYNATTNKTKIRISAHNNSTSARNILVKGLVEGASAAEDLASIALGNKEDVISDWIEFDNAANRTIYIMVSSSAGDVYFTQVKVIESGETPMKQFGEIGYSLNLNKGRFFGLASTDLAFEGLNARLSGDYTALNSGYVKLKATSMSFTLAAPALMTVTTNNSKTYYVTKGAAGTDNETAKTGASEFNLTAGTWFITGGTDEVQITNIEFEAPKCVTPVITEQPSSKVDFATSGKLTATVTVETPSDGGTLSYQWYNAADNSEVTDATSATLTTTTPGTYYVIITNTKEGYQEASVQSDNATLKYRREDDASLIELTYGSEAIALVDGVYDYRVVLPEDATDVPDLSATPTMNAYGATATITNATAFEEFEAVSSVLVTAEDEITTQTYTVTFVVKHPYDAIENVTGNTVWDWRGTVNQQIDDVANKGTVIANYIDGDNFEKIEGQEGAYARRTQNDGVYQGNYLHFNTTVAGKVKFYFRAPSGGDVCTITVKNGSRTVVAGSRGNSLGWSDEVYVTGDVVVEIKNVKNDGTLGQGRIQQIIFTAVTPDYTRDLTEGRYGTICLPNGGIMVGAELFEIAYYGETTKKIFLDNVPSGEMVAGRPYIFYPNKGVSQLAVFYTDEANAEAGDHNGLFGFIGASADVYYNIPDGVGNYILQNNLYREVLAGAQARILSNRAYINLDAISPTEPALAPGRRRISMGIQSEQVATGIGNVQGGEVQSTKVLINGQLFILRGEKMYDATGRLVK